LDCVRGEGGELILFLFFIVINDIDYTRIHLMEPGHPGEKKGFGNSDI
jgi:hypothetical protein